MAASARCTKVIGPVPSAAPISPNCLLSQTVIGPSSAGTATNKKNKIGQEEDSKSINNLTYRKQRSQTRGAVFVILPHSLNNRLGPF